MKVISVPTSLEAMDRLDIDSCLPGDLVEVELEQAEFDELWHSGLFAALNTKLGLMIDDYEDECIPSKSIDNALEVLNFIANNVSFKTEKILKIRELFELAKEKNTGVFLFF